MLVVAALGAAFLAILMLAGIISMADEGVQQDDIVLFSFLAVCFVLEGLIIVGSIRMIFLKNYGLAMTAAVLSLLCSVGVCLALPFGVWALVVLCDTDVRAHFA